MMTMSATNSREISHQDSIVREAEEDLPTMGFRHGAAETVHDVGFLGSWPSRLLFIKSGVYGGWKGLSHIPQDNLKGCRAKTWTPSNVAVFISTIQKDRRKHCNMITRSILK